MKYHYRINRSKFNKERTITLTEYDLRFGDLSTIQFHPKTEKQRAKIEEALQTFIQVVEAETEND